MSGQVDLEFADVSRLPQVKALKEVSRLFYDKGWAVGTSGNFSVVLARDPFRLLITASGRDKRQMEGSDFLVIDASGHPVTDSNGKPSAEAALHLVLAGQPDVGAVLHTHSVWATLLSDWFFAAGGFAVEGYEMLKGLSGITTHEHELWVRVFDNTQDMPRLAGHVEACLNLAENPLKHGFLIRRHGLYTWGKDLGEARRHVEIFEFLFEVMGRRMQLEQR
ncbi:MAG TPA: methylthioribulose 1-phosphate dehydratase [Candidatus Obscuribacterales bacterium]